MPPETPAYEPDDREGSVNRVLIVAMVLFVWSGPSLALCKYRAADGSWTYAKTCAPASDKEINQSASMLLQENAAYKKPEASIESRRLRGYEYFDTTHSGMRVPMVEPNKGPPKPEFTTQ